MKVAPATLEPLFAGFTLEAGRLRHVKFWKETAPARPTS
jgi:hypothetical protein